ncbi:hypothetical protein SAMN04488096_105115 [Mesonia phycicola]|uniref:Uncharacterized protein n=1 Tax=Mesonia phycicola TaxID=579105 RepID=A0A1M6EJZ2_9FLAO|nr:hypothetical protein [Mesonia phycicola]SHI85598.1 hypothetical protein SAMN04488096_105115 [Mesonia phycicola]
MDTSSILIGIFFLLLFMVPLVMVSLKQFNYQKKYQQKLKKFGQDNNLNFNLLEVNYWSFLGLDENEKKLVIGNINEPENLEVIDISQMSHAQLVSPATNVADIKEIKIKLSGAFGVKQIDFYKEDEDISADAAIYLNTAKKWLGYIEKA